MRIPQTIFLLLGLLATSAFAEDGFTSLFDGKTLAGWHLMAMPETNVYYAEAGNFVVTNGAIQCRQLPNRHGALLLSDRQYRDFELCVDIRSDWGCDSGIWLRFNQDEAGIQIVNDYLKGGSIGFVYGEGPGRWGIVPPIALAAQPVGDQLVAISAADVHDGVTRDGMLFHMDAAGWNKTWKCGGWNALKIRCVGQEPKITTWINGVKVMEIDGVKFRAQFNPLAAPSPKAVRPPAAGRERAGQIGLQLHPGGRWAKDGAALYRNLQIKELPSL